MVLGTIFDGEVKKVLQLENEVANQTGIICLANGGYTDTIHGNSMHEELSSGKLFVVCQFILQITQAPTLLVPKFVKYRAH